MRKLLLFFYCLVTTIYVNAYDFEMDSLYYNILSDSTVEVASCKATDNAIIPSNVSYQNKDYRVTHIRGYAFRSSKIKSISIPNSITFIGSYAFENCQSLKEAHFASIESLCSIEFDHKYSYATLTESWANPLASAHHLYINDKEIFDLEIPMGITEIGEYAFDGCYEIRSVTLPSSLQRIGGYSFNNSRFKRIYIPSSVKEIGDRAFSNDSLNRAEFPDINTLCSINYGNWGNPLYYAHNLYINGELIKDLIIPNSVTSLGLNVFMWLSEEDLSSITIPNSVVKFGEDCLDLYPGKVYVERGSHALLCAWEECAWNGKVFETGTENKLIPPTISVISKTQTTATFKMDNKYPEYKYFYGYDEIVFSNDNTFVLTDFLPQNRTGVSIDISKDSIDWNRDWTDYYHYHQVSTDLTTDSISPTIKVDSIYSSSSWMKGSYIVGDANVVYESFRLGSNTYIYKRGEQFNLLGLDPNTNVTVYYDVYIKKKDDSNNILTIDGINYARSYSTSVSFKTKDLELETKQPKVVNTGNVIVQATSNLDDAETNVGFEWRRTDWTDDFASNTGGGYLYDGTMEGYIRNLATAYLWKYRPYYESNSGTRYYGDWVGIDPTNTNYFEPTVHTYDKVNVDGNTAKVRGYAQRGTDNVTEQGFLYWRNNGASNAKGNVNYAPSVPNDAQTVTVRTSSSPVMEATITGLDYNTDYSYVAFVTTSEGTFYGEEQTFKTGGDPTGIIEVTTDNTSQHKYPTGIYDLNGRKLPKMQRGVNIVRFEDGTVKKILVK